MRSLFIILVFASSFAAQAAAAQKPQPKQQSQVKKPVTCRGGFDGCYARNMKRAWTSIESSVHCWKICAK
jgi:hypothetical protein